MHDDSLNCRKSVEKCKLQVQKQHMKTGICYKITREKVIVAMKTNLQTLLKL